MSHPRSGAGFRKPLTWLGIGVLATVVIALVLLALRQGGGEPVAERADLGVTPQAVEPVPEPTPTPTPTETVSPTAVTPAFGVLSALGETSFWRAAAATCSPGVDVTAPAPAIERSGDGTVWANVDPAASVDVRQVLWLQAIDESSAEAVVLAGPECATQVLRTFTSGNFWEPYPSSITGAAVIDASAGVLRTANAELPLPCALPAIAVTGGPANSPTVLCSGTIASWSGDSWQMMDLPQVVAAARDTEDNDLVTAREGTTDCTGVLVEQWVDGAPQDQRCLPVTGALAIQATGDRVLVWNPNGVEVLSWAA